MKKLGRFFKPKDSRKEPTTLDSASDEEHPKFRLEVQTFSFFELSTATADFSRNHEIGSGSSSKVYEGHLPGIGKVAVKRLCFDATRSSIHQRNEFLKEVYVLNSMNHPNIVKLIGCCSEESEHILVYEYMPMGNLHQCLSDETVVLDWNTRMKIALGAARGLEQLHLKANPPIIHRDFKAANILLDQDFQPKVSDFGIAKIAPAGDELTATTAGIKGTPGYIAPEYSLCAGLSIRSDIYSFGVVLLEIITGRKALDRTRPEAEKNLAYWVKAKLNDKNNYEELVDPRLRGSVSVDVLSMALAVAKNCVMENDIDRPDIEGVIEGLLDVITKSSDHKASSSSTN